MTLTLDRGYRTKYVLKRLTTKYDIVPNLLTVALIVSEKNGSVGLKKKDELNLDFSKFKKKFFYDVIYNPKITNFLKLGKELGNKIENGEMMFIFQAQAAFKIWHGIKPQVTNELINFLRQ